MEERQAFEAEWKHDHFDDRKGKSYKLCKIELKIFFEKLPKLLILASPPAQPKPSPFLFLEIFTSNIHFDNLSSHPFSNMCLLPLNIWLGNSQVYPSQLVLWLHSEIWSLFFSPWLPLLSSPLHYVTLCMTPAHVARPLLSTAPLSIGRRNQWGPPHTALDSALLNTSHVSFSYRNSDWFRCHTQTTSMNSNMPVPRSLFARKRRKHWSFWRIK